ncbi:MAG: hypothetical protein ACYSR5_05180 [Planctomycetota bacterium]|jgi:hypothetical protein
MIHTQTKTSDSKPAKKRISPFKVGLIILGLLLALVVLRIVLAIIAVPTISVDYVAKFSELTKPPDYDPNQNAAAYYEAAFAHLVDMPRIIERDLWPEDMNEIELDVVKTLLALNSRTLSSLKLAVSKPYYWVYRSSCRAEKGWLMVNLRELVDFLRLAECLSFQIKFELQEGETKEAVESILTLHKMGSHLCGPKFLSEQLLGIKLKSDAIRLVLLMLDRYQFDPETLRHTQQRLIYQISQANKELDFRGAKFIVYEIVQQTFTDNGRGGGFLIPRKALEHIEPVLIFTLYPGDDWLEKLYRKRYLRFFWVSVAGPSRQKTVKIVDKYFEYADTLKRQTPWQLHVKDLNSDDDTRQTIKGWFAKELLASSYYSLIEGYHRYRAEESALIGTLALMRYKAEVGQLPEHLTELISTGYLRELPMDPYSDGPLIYKQVGDDFMLYSVGADFEDDGGIRSYWGEGDAGDQVFWPVERPNAEQTRLTRRVRRVK